MRGESERGEKVPYAQLPEMAKRALETPAGFGRHYLKIPLTERQAAAADAFINPRARVSVLCCNEAGKTTKILPSVIFWHLFHFPRMGENGGVTVTSGAWNQIEQQLMPALHQYRSRFPHSWQFLDTEIKISGVPNLMAYACVQPGRAEGFHGSKETPLMMLFDECKSVADDIIQAGEDRCRPQRLGLLSSPGFAMGKFYRTHTSEAAFWSRFKITVEDCPWIDPKAMRRVIEREGGGDYERGLQAPIIRSAYWAEFMPFVQDSLISLAEIEACLADPPAYRPGERHAFCDFAAGGDENVLAVRQGNRVWIADAWRERDTMSAVGRFVQHFVRLKKEIALRPEEIEGDYDGLGKGFVDRMHELDWPILPFLSNGTALNPQRYRNRISEVWFTGIQSIQQRKTLLCDDDDLKGQLVDRTRRAESSGRQWVESKEDLFRRQARDGRPQRSPDRADAVLGAMAPRPVVGTVSLGTPPPDSPWANDPDYDDRREVWVPEDLLRGKR